jgi:molecular chaperone GrpE (heat shock protein)
MAALFVFTEALVPGVYVRVMRWLALVAGFSDTVTMSETPEWKQCLVPKWPFLLGNILLLAAAAYIAHHSDHPGSRGIMILITVAVAVGGILSCIPFYLDYKAAGRLVDAEAVTTVAEQMDDIKKYAAQIAMATDQWARVQEATKGNTDKTVVAASQIAERMAVEIREFNDFQVKLNDTEKGALRLEVEKLRRNEGEWLQVVARILDHVFALHTAAVRSGQQDLAEQIGQFQNACRDAARRVGLTPFGAEVNEAFDPKKHRAQGVENPVEGTPIAGLLGPGMTFQGRLIRPALVKLAVAGEAAAPAAAEKPAATEPETPGQDQLTLETD